MLGPPPKGDHALTPVERSAAWRACRKAAAVTLPTKPPVVVHYRKPVDRRSLPARWADAIQTLGDLLDDYQAWGTPCRSSLTPRSIGHGSLGGQRNAIATERWSWHPSLISRDATERVNDFDTPGFVI